MASGIYEQLAAWMALAGLILFVAGIWSLIKAGKGGKWLDPERREKTISEGERESRKQNKETKKKKKTSRKRIKDVEKLGQLEQHDTENNKKNIKALDKIINILRTKHFDDTVKSDAKKILQRLYESEASKNKVNKKEEEIAKKIENLELGDLKEVNQGDKLPNKLIDIGKSLKGSDDKLEVEEEEKIKYYIQEMRNFLFNERNNFKIYEGIIKNIREIEAEYIRLLRGAYQELDNNKVIEAMRLLVAAKQEKLRQIEEYNQIQEILKKIDIYLRHELQDLSKEKYLEKVVKDILKKDKEKLKKEAHSY